MPNWKKLIVSGSDASLNSLNVTTNVTAQSFTGSFSGSFTAPGSTTQVVYNNNGVLAASSNFVFSGSRVGIGTSTPVVGLETYGGFNLYSNINNHYLQATSVSSTDGTLQFRRNGGANGWTRLQLGPSTKLSSDDGSGEVQLLAGGGGYFLTFYSNGSEAMRINTSGNVGIGTTSPSFLLDVNGTARIKGNVDITTSGGTNVLLAYSSYVQAWQSFYVSQAGGAHNFAVSNASSGGNAYFNNVNVGIGTTNPSQSLSVNGAIESLGDNFNEGGQLILRGTTYRYNVDNYNGQALRFFREDDATLSGGTVLMYVSASGNVGIGSTSPGYKLDVNGTVNVAAGNYYRIGGTAVAFVTGNEVQYGNQGGSDYVTISTGTTEKFRITTAGNVGIGTASPTATLEVNGNVKAISFTGSFSGSITHAVSASYALSSSYALTSTTASHALTASYVNPLTQDLILTGSFITTGNITASNALINGNLTVIGTASFTYTTSSIVNIGASTIILNTDNPAVRFGGISVIDSGSFGTSSTGSLLWDSEKNRWIYSNPSGSTYDGGLLISGPRNTTGLGNEEGTTLNALMKGQGGDHITSSGVFEVSGSVGIGTSSPSYKLQVNGDGNGLYVLGANTSPYTQTIATFVYGGNNNSINIENQGGKASFQARDGSSNPMDLHINPVGGNVGIGITSPSYKLDVQGSAGNIARITDGTSHFLFYAGSGLNEIATTGPFLFTVSGSERMRITTAGNVGIGTTTPTEKLHVVGAVRLNDVYFQSNNPATYPNFAIGTSNFTSTVTGYGNIGFGYEALSLLTSGRYNVAAGYTALANVTTGQANVALGPFALRQTTTGTYNIGIGDDALTNNINGSYNIGFGSSALENNINGEENIGIGEGAILGSKHGSYNIGMGYYALNYLTNTTSSYNIGIGYLSGGNLAGGIHNTYLGNNLHVVSTGSYNVFIGGNIAVNALGFSSATNTVVIADNSGNVKLFADSTGSVGIGTVTPTAKLEVNGNIKATSFTGSFSGSVAAPGSTTQIVYNNSGVLAADSGLVYSGSNVGIGITTPTERLHIVGSTSGNQFARITATDFDSSAAWVAQNDSGDNVVYRVFSSGVIGTQMSNALSRSASLLANLGGSGVFLLGTFSNTNFVLGTNNTERMRITNSGNVGIGTTSPAYKLDVVGIIRSNSSNVGTINLGTDSFSSANTTSQIIGQTSPSYTSTGKLSFKVLTWGVGSDYGPTEQMYIDVTGPDTKAATLVMLPWGGNVGIGTTSPSQVLEVQGQAQIGNDNVTSAGLFIARKNSNQAKSHYFLSPQESPTYQWIEGGYFTSELAGVSVANNSGKPYYEAYIPAGQYKAFGFINQTTSGSSFTSTAATASMVLYQGGNIALAPTQGNVGIGTYSPSARLHISGSTDATQRIIVDGSGNNSSLHLNYNGSNVGFINSYQNSELNIGTSVSAFVNFYTNNTERMRIAAGGNVGIGTTNPAYKLDVVSSNSLIARFNGSAVAASSATEIDVLGPQSNGELNLGVGGSTLSDSTNNIQNKGFITAGSGLDGLNLRSDQGYVQITAGGITPANEVARFTAGGNVGIGTSSPSYKLEVVGAVSASTYYGDGSNLTNIGSGSVSAAGSDGQIQYNNNGLFGGASNLYYNDTTNRVGIKTSSPGYDLDVSGSARVQDRLRVGVVNSGNGVVHESSAATINPSSATTVWTVSGTAGICAFIEYYVINSNTGTSQRAGNIVTTWNASGTPQITHTETSTPDVGSTSPITFSTTLSLGGDPQLIATNSGGDTWYMIMNYRYF